MKKTFLAKTTLLSSLVGLAILGNTASANNCKFYAGVGVDYTKYSLDKTKIDASVKAKDSGVGMLLPILGMVCHENFGVEAGYVLGTKASIKNLTKPEAKFKISNMYLDLVGFMPWSTGQFDLLGGLGVGRTTIKKENNQPTISSVKNKIGVRVKAGAQYNVNTNIAVRAIASYQTANNSFTFTDNTSSQLIKNLTSVALSVVYTM